MYFVNHNSTNSINLKYSWCRGQRIQQHCARLPVLVTALHSFFNWLETPHTPDRGSADSMQVPAPAVPMLPRSCQMQSGAWSNLRANHKATCVSE